MLVTRPCVPNNPAFAETSAGIILLPLVVKEFKFSNFQNIRYMKKNQGNFRTIWHPVIVAMFLFFLLQARGIRAEVTLPYILSDNMVLQRDIPVNIWGWAKPG